jgi:hypothetical protein
MRRRSVARAGALAPLDRESAFVDNGIVNDNIAAPPWPQNLYHSTVPPLGAPNSRQRALLTNTLSQCRLLPAAPLFSCCGLLDQLPNRKGRAIECIVDGDDSCHAFCSNNTPNWIFHDAAARFSDATNDILYIEPF